MLRGCADRIAAAEVRLDRMPPSDLPALVQGAPCPLIATCRPPREGGAFDGGERERIELLSLALSLGCAWVDVEWDSVDALKWRAPGRIIASRHFLDGMPDRLLPYYEALRGKADAVKLAAVARRPADILPALELYRHAATPVIAIAMEAAGALTRVLAPCFPTCLFTYAALDRAAATAPGQLTLSEMIDGYHLDRVGPGARLHLHAARDAAEAAAIVGRNAAAPGEALHVPLRFSAEEIEALLPGLRSLLPPFTLTAG